MAEVSREDKVVWLEGYYSYDKDGEPLKECPYPIDSKKYDLWLDGWHSGFSYDMLITHREQEK